VPAPLGEQQVVKGGSEALDFSPRDRVPRIRRRSTHPVIDCVREVADTAVADAVRPYLRTSG
jgi:hypothetical protein